MDKFVAEIEMQGPQTAQAASGYRNIFIEHNLGTRDIVVQAWRDGCQSVGLATLVIDENMLMVVDTKAAGTLRVVVIG